MKRSGSQIYSLSYEDIKIMIDKYSNLITNYHEFILTNDFTKEIWKTNGIKLLSYIKALEVLESELEKYISKFEKESELSLLNEAQEKLENLNTKIFPTIEEIKKLVYYFQARDKKLYKFKNTYEDIISILKKEAKKEKDNINNDIYSINNINVNIEKEDNNAIFDSNKKNDEKNESLIDKKDEEITIKKEEKIKEIIYEEYEDTFFGKIKFWIIKNWFVFIIFLGNIKIWIIKNWFVFIIFLIFFILGIIVEKTKYN